MDLTQVSQPGQIAEAGAGISMEELALALRNHGMPLEALRYEITPAGLHYLLTHYDIPAADAVTWTLTVGGQVDRPLSLDLPQLLQRPSVTVRVTMECAGNGRARLEPRPISQPWLTDAVGTADWTGVPLRDLLTDAGAKDSAVEVVLTGADHGVERGVEQDYQRSLPKEEAMRPEVIVAYAMNGNPLPPQHGHPLRLIAPGWYGMAHVKWLRDIAVVDKHFTGFQQDVAYRLRQSADELGEPVTRIRPRALLVPPGFPDFMSRTRVVAPGEHLLEGRAWSGQAPVTSVDVSADGGMTWVPANLADGANHPWAWRRFTARWHATPGSFTLTARATDASGAAQPRGQAWNRGGFENNAVQAVAVVCLPR